MHPIITTIQVLLSSLISVILRPCRSVFREKKDCTIQYGNRKGQLMHECSPKQSRMGTARRNKTQQQTKTVVRREP